MACVHFSLVNDALPVLLWCQAYEAFLNDRSHDPALTGGPGEKGKKSHQPAQVGKSNLVHPACPVCQIDGPDTKRLLVTAS